MDRPRVERPRASTDWGYDDRPLRRSRGECLLVLVSNARCSFLNSSRRTLRTEVVEEEDPVMGQRSGMSPESKRVESPTQTADPYRTQKQSVVLPLARSRSRVRFEIGSCIRAGAGTVAGVRIAPVSAKSLRTRYVRRGRGALTLIIEPGTLQPPARGGVCRADARRGRGGPSPGAGNVRWWVPRGRLEDPRAARRRRARRKSCCASAPGIPVGRGDDIGF